MPGVDRMAPEHTEYAVIKNGRFIRLPALSGLLPPGRGTDMADMAITHDPEKIAFAQALSTKAATARDYAAAAAGKVTGIVRSAAGKITSNGVFQWCKGFVAGTLSFIGRQFGKLSKLGMVTAVLTAITSRTGQNILDKTVRFAGRAVEKTVMAVEKVLDWTWVGKPVAKVIRHIRTGVANIIEGGWNWLKRSPIAKFFRHDSEVPSAVNNIATPIAALSVVNNVVPGLFKVPAYIALTIWGISRISDSVVTKKVLEFSKFQAGTPKPVAIPVQRSTASPAPAATPTVTPADVASRADVTKPGVHDTKPAPVPAPEAVVEPTAAPNDTAEGATAAASGLKPTSEVVTTNGHGPSAPAFVEPVTAPTPEAPKIVEDDQHVEAEVEAETAASGEGMSEAEIRLRTVNKVRNAQKALVLVSEHEQRHVDALIIAKTTQRFFNDDKSYGTTPEAVARSLQSMVMPVFKTTLTGRAGSNRIKRAAADFAFQMVSRAEEATGIWENHKDGDQLVFLTEIADAVLAIYQEAAPLEPLTTV